MGLEVEPRLESCGRPVGRKYMRHHRHWVGGIAAADASLRRGGTAGPVSWAAGRVRWRRARQEEGVTWASGGCNSHKVHGSPPNVMILGGEKGSEGTGNAQSREAVCEAATTGPARCVSGTRTGTRLMCMLPVLPSSGGRAPRDRPWESGRDGGRGAVTGYGGSTYTLPNHTGPRPRYDPRISVHPLYPPVWTFMACLDGARWRPRSLAGGRRAGAGGTRPERPS